MKRIQQLDSSHTSVAERLLLRVLLLAPRVHPRLVIEPASAFLPGAGIYLP
jgi:hypothetical protein